MNGVRNNCIIFDYDLTLVDLMLDKQVMREHLSQACEALGLGNPFISWESSFYAYRDIVENRLLDLPDPDRVKKFLDQAMAAGEFEALPRTRPLPGAKAALSTIRQERFKIGVVSSNSVRILETTGRKYNLWRFFDAVWGRENPGRSKPAPDKLLGCAKELGSNNALYVGDDPTDMDAANSAGFTGIAVLRVSDRMPTPSCEELENRGAVKVIGSLKELPSLLSSLL